LDQHDGSAYKQTIFDGLIAQVKTSKMAYIADKWKLIEDKGSIVETLPVKKINDKKANDKQSRSTLPLGYHVSREGATVLPYYFPYMRLEHNSYRKRGLL